MRSISIRECVQKTIDEKMNFEGHCMRSWDIYHDKCGEYSVVELLAPNGTVKKWCYNCGFIGFAQSYQKDFGMSKNRSTRHTKWSYAVRKRDNFTCKTCGSKENLEAHHIIPYSVNENLRYEVSNGITLCRTCHNKIHSEEL